MVFFVGLLTGFIYLVSWCECQQRRKNYEEGIVILRQILDAESEEEFEKAYHDALEASTVAQIIVLQGLCGIDQMGIRRKNHE
jgi:hypothetical protein